MAKAKTDEISVEEKLKALFEIQRIDSTIDRSTISICASATPIAGWSGFSGIIFV